MSKSVLAACLLFCIPAFANIKHSLTMNGEAASSSSSAGFSKAIDLENMCREDAGANYSFCEGYLFGEAQTFRLVQNFADENGKLLLYRTVCFPSGVSSREMVLVFRKYLADHPENLRKEANFAVYMSFAAAYPCNKVSKK